MSDHKTLAEALVAAQLEYPEVEKTATANYGKYATLDSLIAKTRPVLNKHGLSVQQFPTVGEFGPVLRTIIQHSSGEVVAADTPLFLQKQDMQALGAAVTYARRYAWSAALGIASEHDDDAQSIVAVPAVEKTSFAFPTARADDGNAHDEPPATRTPPADGGDPSQVVLNFGKHNGKKIMDVDRGYLTWWTGQEQPKNPEAKRAWAAAQIYLKQTAEAA